jgi:hypothetical protein
MSPWFCVLIVATASVDRASSSPWIGSVFPPGVTLGVESLVKIDGRGLADASQVHVSGAGVTTVGVQSTPSSILVRLRVTPDAIEGFRELRVETPFGISNLIPIRVDSLAQREETESNDRPEKANRVALNQAVAGHLTQGDRDCFLVEARGGDRLTIDWEARRLGTPVLPLVTVMTPEGVPIQQQRESRGIERDCRFEITVPAVGRFVVELRDQLHGGAEGAYYRLRVTNQPYATAVFPLGGRLGTSLLVTASGGNLAKPVRRKITLPDRIEMFRGSLRFPGGLNVPTEYAVGQEPELTEPAATRQALSVREDVTVNGVIEKAGEVDRYQLSVESGDRIQLRIRAAALGSWLDSVLTLRDAQGRLVAENDDLSARGRKGLGTGATDSALEYVVSQHGILTLEVADRDLDGGPEFGYRLELGTPRPELSVTMSFHAGQAADATDRTQSSAPIRITREAFTLRRGQTASLPIEVRSNSLVGPITIVAEGLPEGVTSRPITVDMRSANRVKPDVVTQLRIEAGREAALGSGAFQVVAEGETIEGTRVRAVASTVVELDHVRFAPPSVPVTRRIETIFVQVVDP